MRKEIEKMSVKIIYFVHGTTTDNESHIATGQNPGILKRNECPA